MATIRKPATAVQPVLIPVADAAAMLGISIWTARRWCYEGVVASANVGKKLFIPPSEIERLVSENLRPALKKVG
jgi:predicted site-specific integrase-resolvase